VNVWLFDQGYEAYLHNPGVCNVLYYEMLASHTLPMINYSDGTFAGEEAANIAFFDFVSQVDSEFGQRVPIEDVGIYYSSSSILSRWTPGWFRDFSAQPHQFAFWGWATGLGELHYQYKAVPEWKLDSATLADLRVLVIPEAQVVEPNDVNDVLEPWVQDGGLLIVTGVSGRNLGEDGNFDVNPTGYSLASLTGVTDIATAPAEQRQSIGAGKVLYIRDNIGMEYYNADTTRPSLLPQFDDAMTTVFAGGAPLVLTAGAGVSSRVGLSVFEDSCAGRLFVDVTNFDINLETDEITDTPPLTFSVQLPQWLQEKPLSVSVFSPNSPPAADVNTPTPDRVEVTVQPVRYYAGIVIESNSTADLNNDSNTDFIDFAVMASHWFEQNFSSELVGQIVGWWEFDDGNGTTAHDSAGDNHGTLYGDPNWVPGCVGTHALDFDGNEDYVSADDNDDSLDIDDHMTIAAWVRLSNLDTYYFIVTKQPSGTAATNYPGNYGFRIKPSTGYLQLTHQTSPGQTWSTYTSTSGIGTGTWHHVAVTLVEEADVSFYIDGFPAGTSSQSGTFGIVNAEPVRIGTRKDAYSYFDGAIDDVRIFDYELNADEVMQVYEGLPVEDRFICCLDGNPPADLNNDCQVNFADLSFFAQDWLKPSNP
jgi:hypothetical protein